MSNHQRRRFIAGAICPKCKAMDTIMLYFEHNVEKLTCVECDYTEAQTDQAVTSQSKGADNVIGLFKPE